jgi:hypothetical protein
VTVKQQGELASLLKILAFAASVLFGAWQVDEHFVTRREFSELRADVRLVVEHIQKGSEK